MRYKHVVFIDESAKASSTPPRVRRCCAELRVRHILERDTKGRERGWQRKYRGL